MALFMNIIISFLGMVLTNPLLLQPTVLIIVSMKSQVTPVRGHGLIRCIMPGHS